MFTGTWENIKILNSIIIFNFIDVMNNFIFMKFSPYKIFYNKAVLSCIFIFSWISRSYNSISRSIQKYTIRIIFPAPLAFPTAKFSSSCFLNREHNPMIFPASLARMKRASFMRRIAYFLSSFLRWGISFGVNPERLMARERTEVTKLSFLSKFPPSNIKFSFAKCTNNIFSSFNRVIIHGQQLTDVHYQLQV